MRFHSIVFGRIPNNTGSLDAGFLLLRVSFGLLMLLGHGWSKLINYSTLSEKFPDVLGLGSAVALALAVFAEFFCSLLLTLGLATRLAVLPLIATMLVAVLIIHIDDPFAKQELALLYLFPYLTLLCTGAGRYSLDAYFAGKTSNAHKS